MSLTYTGGLGKRPGYQYRPPAKLPAKVPITLNPSAAPAWQAAAAQFAASTPNPGGGFTPPQAPPTSAQAQAGIASAYQQYNDTLAGLGAQEQQYSQEYGFNPQGGLDLSNPYSRAVLLEQAGQRAQRGNTNNYAARGLGYSGALQNAQNFSTSQNAMQQDRLRRAYQALIAGIAQKRQQAKTQYGATTGQAAGAAADAGMGYGTIPQI